MANLVAKKIKSHTIAEGLIIHICKIIVNTVLGEAESESSKIPVSNNTVKRVDDLSNNNFSSLSEILQNNKFAIQVDETSGKALLLAFVRFKNEGEIMENYFCSKLLPETANNYDVFNILSSYLKPCGLSWNRCVGICTDAAPSMIGSA